MKSDVRLLVDNVWPGIRDIAAGARPRIAVTAYFTTDQSLPLGRGDVLIVDASDEIVKAGGTSAKALSRVCAKGAEVFSLSGLHAKVFVQGSNIFIGSANLTDNSERLTEAVLVSDGPELRVEVMSWIEQLRKRANRVDAVFLKRILALPVARSAWTVGSRGGLSLLEAVQADDSLLAHFTFRAYSEDTVIDKEAIKRALKSDAKLLLPAHWAHFEDEWRQPERKAIDELETRYLISFEGTGIEGKRLESIRRLDPFSYSFVCRLKNRGALVSVFDIGKPCPFRLTGPDAKALCDLMNAGLKASPALHSAINHAPLWGFTAETLRALVTAGSSRDQEGND